MAEDLKIQARLLQVKIDFDEAQHEILVLERMLKETKEEAEHLRRQGQELESQLARTHQVA